MSIFIHSRMNILVHKDNWFLVKKYTIVYVTNTYPIALI